MIVIPLGILFVSLYVTSNIPALLDVTPLAFIIDMPEKRSLVQLAITGQPLVTVLPIIATALWIAGFVAVAVWRFGREEF